MTGRSRAVLFTAAAAAAAAAGATRPAWLSEATTTAAFENKDTVILHFKEEELGSFQPTKRITVLTFATRILWSFQRENGAHPHEMGQKLGHYTQMDASASLTCHFLKTSSGDVRVKNRDRLARAPHASAAPPSTLQHC